MKTQINKILILIEYRISTLNKMENLFFIIHCFQFYTFLYETINGKYEVDRVHINSLVPRHIIFYSVFNAMRNEILETKKKLNSVSIIE